MLSSFNPIGIQPDFCLVIACLIGFRTGPVSGLIVGFGLGFLQDLFSAGPFGLHTVTKAGVGFLAGVFARNLSNRQPHAAFVPVMACSRYFPPWCFCLWSRMGMGLGRDAVRIFLSSYCHKRSWMAWWPSWPTGSSCWWLVEAPGP